MNENFVPVEKRDLAWARETFANDRFATEAAGVIIEEGAVVTNSIIMGGSVIKAGAKVEKAIIAENCVIGENTELGFGEEAENKYKPNVYAGGLVTIGEYSTIPGNVRIGKNTAVIGRTTEADYPDGVLESGGSIIR